MLVPPVKPGHGEDKAIVPCDFNLISDVDFFRELLDRVPRGASFTMVSCHSGGLMDNEQEQIGPSVDLAAGSGSPAPTTTRTTRARFLPCAAFVDHLSGASGVDASQHVGYHLVELSAPTPAPSSTDAAGVGAARREPGGTRGRKAMASALARQRCRAEPGGYRARKKKKAMASLLDRCFPPFFFF
ncbi:hypothetical protein ACP70R_045753 [Stipagrostis hirtigluma subsp. patula]